MFFLSIVLVLAHGRFAPLEKLRFGLEYVTEPILFVGAWPNRFVSWINERLASKKKLRSENERLQQQVLLLERRVQQVAALAAENDRLRELLNSSLRVESHVMIAEIISVDNDPFRHEIILNRGQSDQVKKGQPVLDSNGLMGQIIQVGPNTSRVLLISDSTHAVPVQVNRNGVRAIAVGSGFLDKLYLIYVPNTADIVVGDLLVSSGLGERFPFGYPVAKITAVEHHPGRSFATVEARPESYLDRRRHVLIVMQPSEQE